MSIVQVPRMIGAKKARTARIDIEVTCMMYSFGIGIDKCISSTSGRMFHLVSVNSVKDARSSGLTQDPLLDGNSRADMQNVRICIVQSISMRGNRNASATNST